MRKIAAEFLKKAGVTGWKGPCWAVGGAVRDALLGRPFSDVDLIVPRGAAALAQNLARRLAVKSFPLDEERNIYRLTCVAGGEQWTVDVSDFEGKSLEADLSRRDLTINALAVPAAAFIGKSGWKRDVVDFFDGRKDLARRRLRFTHPRVIASDPLRLLRLFRFRAEMDFTIDAASVKAAAKSAALLKRPAKERVREEILRILSTPRAGRTFLEMDKAGLLTVVFPEGEPMRKTARDFYGKGGVWGHSLAALASFDRLLAELPALFPKLHRPLLAHLEEAKGGFPRFAHLKLAVLLHDVGKPDTETRENGQVHFYGHDHLGGRMAAKIAARLRLSHDEGRSLTRLVHAHMRPGNLAHQPVLTDRAIYRFYRDLGDDAVGMLIVSLADHFTYLSDRARKGRKDPVYLTTLKMLTNYFLKRETVVPPKIIDGNVLMKALKLKPGPVVGEILNAIREAQSEGKINLQNEAIDFARGWLKKSGAGDGNRTHV